MVKISEANTFGFKIKDVARKSSFSSRLEQITDRTHLRKAVIDDLAEIVRMARLFLNSGGSVDCSDEAQALFQTLELYFTTEGIAYPEGSADFIKSTRKALPRVQSGMEMVFKDRNSEGIDLMLNAYEYG